MGTCGTGGAMCAACPPARPAARQVRLQRQLLPNGCCDSSGKCQTSSNPTCGTGGVACTTCGTGTTCASGKCVCNASSCGAGCCNGASCLPYASESDTLCGVGGATCAPCGSGLTCSTANGACGATNTGPCTWSGGPSSYERRDHLLLVRPGDQGRGRLHRQQDLLRLLRGGVRQQQRRHLPHGITDTVPNTGTQYFAAFPVGSFGQGTYCGMCVDVTWMGKTITANDCR